MKHAALAAALILIIVALSPAQTSSDSTRRVDNARRRPMLLDQNGDGVADRMRGSGMEQKRRIDRFIDLNGDGICDTREHGLGFQRQMSGNGKKGGRQGQGRGR